MNTGNNLKGTIHHVEIYVSDLKSSIRFWKWLLIRKFSYSIYAKWNSGISFKLGATYIVLVQTEKQHLKPIYHRKKTGLNHLAFHGGTKKFVDELTLELKKRKVKVLYEDRHPYAAGKDYYAVFFEDPDRIKVEVVADK
jgi:catechol 2,3-dioxygenase-like lactoylglutathione lyase family enzyme